MGKNIKAQTVLSLWRILTGSRTAPAPWVACRLQGSMVFGYEAGPGFKGLLRGKQLIFHRWA
jgi:hypothetical protein